jgi:hypothetical protein
MILNSEKVPFAASVLLIVEKGGRRAKSEQNLKFWTCFNED